MSANSQTELEQVCHFVMHIQRASSNYSCLEIDADLYNMLAQKYPVIPYRLLSNRRQLTASTGHGVTAVCTGTGNVPGAGRCLVPPTRAWELQACLHTESYKHAIKVLNLTSNCVKNAKAHLESLCSLASLAGF